MLDCSFLNNWEFQYFIIYKQHFKIELCFIPHTSILTKQAQVQCHVVANLLEKVLVIITFVEGWHREGSYLLCFIQTFCSLSV